MQTVSNRQVFMQPEGVTTYKSNPQNLDTGGWDYENSYTVNFLENGKIGKSVHIPVIICPPDHLLDFSAESRKVMEDNGIRYEISPVLRKSELEGRAVIRLEVTKEIPSSLYDNGFITLKLDLKKPLEDSVIDPGLYSSNYLYPNNEIFIACQLPLHHTAAIPVFQRVYGNYSNRYQDRYKYKYYQGNSSAKWTATALGNTSPSADNAFNVNGKNWNLRPTGVLPEFNNASYAESRSEYMKLVTRNVNGMQKGYNFSEFGHSATYDLEVGDGESHYILLDKTHAGMFYEFDEVSVKEETRRWNAAAKSHSFYKVRDGRAPELELVEYNGSKAIRIEGGRDFMVYDRMMIKNRKKITYEYFSPTENSTDSNWDVSENTGIYNYKSNMDQFNENVNGYVLNDYALVRRYGVPLTYVEGRELEFDLVEDRPVLADKSTALDAQVIHQIVYWKKGSVPIRVRYHYWPSFGGGDSYYQEAVVIASDGGYGAFNNAKDYFGDSYLYVTKPDSRGEYFINSKIAGEKYLANSTVGQLGTGVPGVCLFRNHQMMLDYNPHYEDLFGGAMYIVSDFDLGAAPERKVYYKGYADYYYTCAAGGYEEGNMRLFSLVASKGSSKGKLWTRGMSLNGMPSLNGMFVIFDDEHNDDGMGWFNNYNNGARYYKGNFNDLPYNIVNGMKHKFFSATSKFADLGSYLIGPSESSFPVSIGNYGVSATKIDQMNYKAIISILKHNGITDVLDTDRIYSLDEFKAAIAGKEARLIQLFQNSIPFSSLGNYARNAKGNLLLSTRENVNNYTSYKTNALYIKRETEENYNKIHPLNDFEKSTGFDNYKVGPYDNWCGGLLIMEDITNTSYYNPVSMADNVEVFSNSLGELVLTYKNSYRENNVLIINITHKVGSGHCADDGSGEIYKWEDNWGGLRAVKNLDSEFQQDKNASFSRYYNQFVLENKNTGY
jgi:hypothetical protein